MEHNRFRGVLRNGYEHEQTTEATEEIPGGFTTRYIGMRAHKRCDHGSRRVAPSHHKEGGQSMKDQTIIDRFTNIDNILIDRLIPVLEKLRTGDIIVQTPGEGEDTLQKLLDISARRYNDDNEIIYFSYPNDGTRAAVDAGETILNFRHGTIKAVDGTITKMSSSLQAQKKDFLRSVAFNADEDVIIQLDDRDKTPVKADTWYGVAYQQFQEMTITTTAATTNVFAFACTNPKHGVEMIGEVTVSIGREERNQAKSDKDSHFTGAIIQNAIEEENITGLSSDEITITGISIIGDEALSYRVWLFETDDFQETDLDNDEFVEFVDLDLSANGARIGATGAYYYAQTNIAIDYEDLDATNELHIALQNLSAAAKTSGAAGEVVIKISYIPRT